MATSSTTTVGVVGAGQLARMLALAGIPMGLRFVFLDPAEDACAAPLGRHLRAGYDERLADLAAHADVVTYEFENVPETSIAFLAERVPVHPCAATLRIARDRLKEKTLFRELGIPTVPHAPVDSLDDLECALEEIGLPAVLKVRTLGYDGKGQQILRSAGDVLPAWQRLGDAPLILERLVEFRREVSALCVRGRTGETVFYPLAENVHEDGILRTSRCVTGDPAQDKASAHAKRLADHLAYVGVLAVEFFDVGGELLANEMAPRVHNSGHWTIEGTETSQFENHLRAILGLPLGATSPIGHSGMVNLIGSLPDTSRMLEMPGAHLHWYGKAPAPGRKLGHVTVRAQQEEILTTRLEGLARLARAPIGGG